MPSWEQVVDPGNLPDRRACPLSAEPPFLEEQTVPTPGTRPGQAGLSSVCRAPVSGGADGPNARDSPLVCSQQPCGFRWHEKRAPSWVHWCPWAHVCLRWHG